MKNALTRFRIEDGQIIKDPNGPYMEYEECKREVDELLRYLELSKDALDACGKQWDQLKSIVKLMR